MTKIVRILSVPGGHSTKFFSVPQGKKCAMGTQVRSKIRSAGQSIGRPGRPHPGVGHPQGVFGVFSYY
jgi:hypothetical protein